MASGTAQQQLCKLPLTALTATVWLPSMGSAGTGWHSSLGHEGLVPSKLQQSTVEAGKTGQQKDCLHQCTASTGPSSVSTLPDQEESVCPAAI